MATAIAANITRVGKDRLRYPSEIRHPARRWSREDDTR
jgi:hypothetical protein